MSVTCSGAEFLTAPQRIRAHPAVLVWLDTDLAILHAVERPLSTSCCYTTSPVFYGFNLASQMPIIRTRAPHDDALAIVLVETRMASKRLTNFFRDLQPHAIVRVWGM